MEDKTLKPLLIDKKAVAGLMSVSIRTVQNLMTAGRLPKPVQLDRRLVRWKLSDIEDYISNL
jgi:predicted DNA-binding transcriptional regulator AlpA